ncbi:hypothetical protein V6N13_149657 [Hibiscus sabdariffa]
MDISLGYTNLELCNNRISGLIPAIKARFRREQGDSKLEKKGNSVEVEDLNISNAVKEDDIKVLRIAVRRTVNKLVSEILVV